MNLTLREAKRLYDLGFAILWIKPRDKAPVKSKWTTGPKESWESLKRSYKVGYNVGVRLGEASKLKHGYLACVDVDVKDSKFLEKANKILKELFGEKTCPAVYSGSGNGSMHLYCVTVQPFKMITLIKEKEGEICVYSTGRQMVLPPSTHPNGGKYHWVNSNTKFPLMEFKRPEKDLGERSTTNDWVPVEYDLTFSPLPEEIIALILHAECEDRSAALYRVVIAMIREGLSNDEIMSVLTEPGYELGKVAYDHAKTSSRKAAANWLFNYTIKTARREHDAAFQFDEEVEVSKLTPDETKAQAKELLPPKPWGELLDRTKNGKVNCTLNNTLLILDNVVGKEVFKRDIFALNDMYGMNTPWGGKKGDSITDDEVRKLKVWFTKKFKIEPSKNMLEDAIGFIAVENAFHPVRDFLDTLEWDGVSRIDGWLKTYLGATGPEPYLSAVGRKTLCAMVARIYQPGIKFDNVLILNGPQGIGKSTAAQILASPPWFLDRLPDLRDKDSMLNLQGIWVVEMGELTNMRLSSVETYKAFLSSQVDKFRLPYGHRRQDFKRQCVIIGSSNPTDFLNDPTGNRRFWPVIVKQCDFKALAQDRDQLLAEAKFVWQDLEEKLYLEPDEEAQAIKVQAKHTSDDTDIFLEQMWDDHLIDLKEKANGHGSPVTPTEVHLPSLFEGMGCFAQLSLVRDSKRVAKLLKKKGYENVRSTAGKHIWKLKDEKDGSLKGH